MRGSDEARALWLEIADDAKSKKRECGTGKKAAVYGRVQDR
ncbi:hypothetical protein [Xylella fastidiosa]|nr:hypothetical protein [Xylella fastidiosa]MDG4872834.1 hypothetical protein [Xylella fastidiosa subsp. multiplex]